MKKKMESSDYYYIVTPTGIYYYLRDGGLKIPKSKIPKHLIDGIKLGSKQQPIDGMIVNDETVKDVIDILKLKRSLKYREQKEDNILFVKACESGENLGEYYINREHYMKARFNIAKNETFHPKK